MADFRRPGTSQPLRCVTLPLCCSMDVILWGGGPRGEKLEVGLSNSRLGQVVEQQRYVGPNMRVFRVTALSSGTAQLEAILPLCLPGNDRPVWAALTIVIPDCSSPPRPEATSPSDDAEAEKLGWDIFQFGLDLVGFVDQTGISDGISGLVSLGRGEYLEAGISGLSMIPIIGDLAKVGKLGKWAKTVAKAIELAAKDAKFAAKLKPALKEIRKVLERVPVEKLPESARQTIQTIKNQIDRFFFKAMKLSRGQILDFARKNGVSSGQFFVKRGEKWVTANVDDVVELLGKSSQKGRHPAAKRNANSILEMMAEKEWKVTAGPHPSASDGTKHITIKIDGVDKQYHLRLDKDGHLFEVSHPDGTGLTDIKPWAAPGSPSGG